jgi:hypothetical protein
MIHALKNLAFRLWLTILLGGLASLSLLPFLGPGLGLERTLVPSSAILAAIFIISGWILNRLGFRSIDQSILEAGEWERSGNMRDAESALKRAVSVFDSFLLSPLMRGRKSEALFEHLARFYLARAEKNSDSEAFIVSYLRSRPQDGDVAEAWLRQAGSRGWLEGSHQDLASRIGKAQPENMAVQQILARYYIMDERTDFQALQTYRRVLDADTEERDGITRRLTEIFLREGRADIWALEIYLEAFQKKWVGREALEGIAACIHWIPETEQTRKLLESGRRLLPGIDDSRIEEMGARFNPPVVEAAPPQPSALLGAMRNSSRLLRRSAWGIAAGAGGALSLAAGKGADLIRFLKRSSRARQAMKWSLAAILAAGAIVMVISTANHLIKREAQRPESSKELPAVGRFTIQVAAYLKIKHARSYADRLREQGVSAYWTETLRRNKKWYQVRVSRFPDKAAARAFGESLKAKGIIEDFYIANYEPPLESPQKSSLR